MLTGITLCSGIGTVESRLKDIVNFVGFAESDDHIAAYHDMAHGVKRNYGNVMHITERLDVDYIHASPPCVVSSTANTRVTYADRCLETETGKAISDIIKRSKPAIFTLENVPAYRQTDAYMAIVEALQGYQKVVVVADAAALGACCTRECMFLLAALEDVTFPNREHNSSPYWPMATEYGEPTDKQVEAFLSTLAHKGWSKEGYYLFDPGGYGKSHNMPISPVGIGFTLVARRQRHYCYAKNTLYTWNHGTIRSYSSDNLKEYMGLGTMIVPQEARVARFLLGNGIHGLHTDHIIRPVIEGAL
jgi:site-specific DNA-cytosine methylase